VFLIGIYLQFLKWGSISLAFAALLFLCGLPAAKAAILIASLDTPSSVSADNINRLRELGDILFSYTATVVYVVLGHALGGGVASNIGLVPSHCGATTNNSFPDWSLDKLMFYLRRD
jgi:hypothetical protein